MLLKITTYQHYYDSIAEFALISPLALPKTRASKIIQFKHYTTDAPV